MFTSVENTRALTGYTVTLDQVNMAQGIIESFIGRVEADIESAYDLAVLGRATSYQAAYMSKNAERVFEQVGVKSIAQTDGVITLTHENESPFIAPMAFMAMRSLSWRRTRTVKTGSVNGAVQDTDVWVTN